MPTCSNMRLNICRYRNLNIDLNLYINEWIFLLHRNAEIWTLADSPLNIVDCIEEDTYRPAQVWIHAHRGSNREYHVCHIE